MNLIQKIFGSKPNTPDQEKKYYERDNIGIRQESQSQGEAYFISLFMRDPETILFYFFPNQEQAEKALAEVPCIKIASDSSKFIGTEIINFGVFPAVDKNDNPVWAALIAGQNVTVETYDAARLSFIKHGGTARRDEKINNMPNAKAIQKNTATVKSKVEFLRKENKMIAGFPAVTETYSAADKASAIEFLKDKVVTAQSYFIAVETPEGMIVKDRQGIFDN